MAWTFCTSGSAIAKAGKNRNDDIAASGSALENWSDEAENIICNIARVDLIDAFDDLEANGKQILQSLSSSLVAQRMINYDMSGYTSRGEATLMLNVLENDIVKNTALIRDDKIKTYLGAT